MTEWEKLKVTDLKEELKSRGIPLTGLKLKQQFIDKLVELDAASKHEDVIADQEDEDGNHTTAEQQKLGVAVEQASDGQVSEKNEQQEPSADTELPDADAEDDGQKTEESSMESAGSPSYERVDTKSDNDQKEDKPALEHQNDAVQSSYEILGHENVKDLSDKIPAEPKKEEGCVEDDTTGPAIEAEFALEEEKVDGEDDSFISQQMTNQTPKEVMTIDGLDAGENAKSTNIQESQPAAQISTEAMDLTEDAGSLIGPAMLTPVPTPEILDDQRKRKRRSLTPVPDSNDIAHKRARMNSASPVATRKETDSLEKVQQATDRAKAIRSLDDPGHIAGMHLENQLEDQRGVSEDKPLISVVPRKEETSQEKQSQRKVRSPSRSSPERDVAPARHPATCSLYIRNFKRPLHIPTLRSRISLLAESIDESPLKVFYLDNIRTHAFISFSSISAASRVRNAMHGTRFPDEPMREPLWIDFIPDEKVQAWIDQETGNSGNGFGGGRGPSKKYEVVYSDDNHGIEAILHEASSAATQSQRPGVQQSRSNRIVPQDSTTSTAAAPGIHPSRAPLVPQPGPMSRSQQPTRPSDPGKGFRALDELFSSTITKPKLYYKLPSQPIIDDRLDMIRGLRVSHEQMGRSGDEGMKRYSFEKNERGGRQEWVDKGPEFGFGRRGQERLTGFGSSYGGGGRGRGGFRGARRGGDSWRGR